MVQLKYFGDDRDFFKYDLITHILRTTDIINYAFIPMLTHHRQSNEGNKVPIHHSARSEELFRFIDLCPNKSLKHWEAWLGDYVESYKTIEPVDEIFFSDENREKYWEKFLPVASIEQALVFVDPDTGMETGRDSYLRKAGRDKYLLNKELKHLIGALADSSFLMIYQHLQRNKKKHDLDVEKKLNQVRNVESSVYAGAYREDDLVFICITKNATVFNAIYSELTQYHEKIAHKYGAIYNFSPGVQKEEAEEIESCTVEEIITSSVNKTEPSEVFSEDNAAQNFVKQLATEGIGHSYKVPIEDIKDKLDYSDLRQNFYHIVLARIAWSKTILYKFIDKHASYNGAFAEEIFNNNKTQKGLIEGWAKTLSDDEAFELLKDNLAIDPAMVLAYMNRGMMGKNNKQALFDWLDNNGIKRHETFSKPFHLLGLIPMFIGLFIMYAGYSSEWSVLWLFIGSLIIFAGALPEVFTQRRIHRDAQAKVIEFLEKGGKEPEYIFLPDNRYEEMKRREQQESHQKNRW